MTRETWGLVASLVLAAACGGGGTPEAPPAEPSAHEGAEEAAPAQPEAAEPADEEGEADGEDDDGPALEVELCIDATPAGARVLLNEVEVAERCATIVGSEGEEIEVEVSAPGHETHKATLFIDDALEPLTVALTPSPAPATPPPAGGGG